MQFSELIRISIKLFLLLTPFFVLTVFVGLTDGMPHIQQRRIALRSSFTIWATCIILYFFGNQIFRYLGITLPAFQIGSGILLLLSGIELVRGTVMKSLRHSPEDSGDITVVPLAIPYTVGPGTTGALMVMGAVQKPLTGWLIEIFGITVAVLFIGALLYFSNHIERLLKRKGLDILSKLTGLFLCALATQLILTGIKVFWAQ
ncbi:MAG: MarC family protein [Kiritimatiellales bacterium]